MSGNNENIDHKLKDKFGTKSSFKVPTDYFESVPINIEDRINSTQKKKGLIRTLTPIASGIAAVLVLAFYLLSSTAPNDHNETAFVNDDATLNLYAEYLLDYADDGELEEELDIEMLGWELENMEENDIIEYLNDDDIDLNDIYDEI